MRAQSDLNDVVPSIGQRRGAGPADGAPDLLAHAGEGLFGHTGAGDGRVAERVPVGNVFRHLALKQTAPF